MENNLEPTFYSTHINEIIEKKPNWLIRYGIAAMLFFLLLFLIAAWLVKYPDTIQGAVQITTPKPPVGITAMLNAPVKRVFTFIENDTVHKGDALLLLESTTSYSQVQQLYSELRKTILTENDTIKPNNLWLDSLGNLQPVYNSYAFAALSLDNYKKEKPFDRRIGSLQHILSGNSKTLKFSGNHLYTSKEDLNSKEKEYQRYRTLFKKGVISASEFEQIKQNRLQKEMGFSNDRKNLHLERMSIANLQREIMELELQKTAFEQQLQGDYIRTKNELKTQLEQWKLQYLIRSPIYGRLSFFNEVNTGDFITAGERILTIIPFQENKLQAVGMFPVENAGKVKVGNKVILKLDAYPYHEYGTIEGVVSRISEIPVENTYSIVIQLPKGLKTNYENKIIFKQRLSATADIVTKDQSVLQRIFFQFENIFKN